MKIEIEYAILFITVAAGIGFFVGNLLRKKLSESKITKAEDLAVRILEDAKREAETVSKEALLQAKDAVFQAKAEFERESKDKRRDLQAFEKRLQQKEENLDKKIMIFDQRDAELFKKDQAISAKDQALVQKEEKVNQLIEEQRKNLERISGFTSEEAKKVLMETLENEAKLDAAKRIKVIEEEAKETADKKSKEILSLAIQRYAGEYVAEKTVSVEYLIHSKRIAHILPEQYIEQRAKENVPNIKDHPKAPIASKAAHFPITTMPRSQNKKLAVAEHLFKE